MATSLPFPAQSAGEIDRLIRAAIIEKTSLRAIYDGGVRLLRPHMLGRNRARATGGSCAYKWAVKVRADWSATMVLATGVV